MKRQIQQNTLVIAGTGCGSSILSSRQVVGISLIWIEYQLYHIKPVLKILFGNNLDEAKRGNLTLKILKNEEIPK